MVVECRFGEPDGKGVGIVIPTPAIFIDRDGVINRNRDDHVKSWDEFEFLPRSLPALSALETLGLPIVVITNQAVINRGGASLSTVDSIHLQMADVIGRSGGRVDGVYCCPHRPDEDCQCRKPKPGLLVQAARDMNIDLGRSILIGDAMTDIQAGKLVGCRTILVLTGRGWSAFEQLARPGFVSPDEITPDLQGAVSAVFEHISPSTAARLATAS